MTRLQRLYEDHGTLGHTIDSGLDEPEHALERIAATAST